MNTVLSDSLSDALGFTEEEVKNLLSDSGFPDRYEEMREWYDGYRFGQGGKTVIYNPWSVIKRIEELAANPDSIPSTPWAGTSNNIIIRELAERGFRRYAIILEVKCSKTSKALYADAGKGATQAKTKKYAVEALREGYETVITYGVSFYRKDCAVRLGQRYTQDDLDGLIMARKKRR